MKDGFEQHQTSPTAPGSLPSQSFTLGIAMVSLVVCVFLSFLAWNLTKRQDQQSAEEEFQRRSAAIAERLQERIKGYEQVLRAGTGLFAGSAAVSREDWARFTTALHMREAYPGLQGLGFARALPAIQLAAFEQQQRASGLPRYRVFPDSLRPEYTAIEFLEPLDPDNQRALGFDMFTEAGSREAMLRARDSGESALSGRVVAFRRNLLDVEARTLLYLPVYRGGTTPVSARERREALLGFVYGVLQVQELMQGALAPLLPGLRLQVFDGELDSPAALLFDSLSAGQALAADYQGRAQLSFAGRSWSLQVGALQSFSAGRQPWAALVLLVGLAVSVLIFVVVLTLLRSESRARDLAGQMSLAFRESEGRHHAIVQATSEGIVTIDEWAVVQTFSAGAERIFGYPASEVIGRNIAFLLPDRYRGRHDELVRRFFHDSQQNSSEVKREVVGRRKGGEEFAATISLGLLRVGAQHNAVALVQDISERKHAEAALAEANHKQKLLFSSLPYPVIATDLAGGIEYINPAAERSLGYAAEELVQQKSMLCFHLGEEIGERASVLSAADGRSAPVSGFAVLVAGCSEHSAAETEWTYLRKDKSSFPASVTVSTVTDRHGRRAGYLFLIVDISERKETEVTIRHLAHHDALTDLPNRSLLNDRLGVAIERARREQGLIGVLMLDLDHFKRINDTLGHQVGDGLLVEISNRLRAMVRRVDTVARMGGDEFVIVLPDINSADSVTAIAAKLVEGIFRPVSVGGHELQVSASIGGCLFPRDGEDEGTLLRNADAAMYGAKRRGRSNFQWYSRSMMKLAEEKMALEAELRRAIDEGQLSLGYQPFICLNSGQMSGMEALLRWRHPERGLISPLVFIPLAEEAGLIIRLGEWVLDQACRFAENLTASLGEPCPVSVNVSPRQLAHAGFTALVANVLARTGLAPQALTLEITESILVDHPDEALKVLTALRAMGVKIAIDDFGTGYSSLSYLTRFPVDKLKIDRAFIKDLHKDPADEAITNTIIAMARSLHLEVTAEGVEDTAQLAYLIEQRCDSAQGFLFGEMASAEEIFELRGRLAAGLLSGLLLPQPPSNGKYLLQ